MNRRLSTAILALSVLVPAARTAAQAVGPTPYLCFDATQQTSYQTPFSGSCGSAESPFAAVVRLGAGTFHIETFEDNSFNAPGVSSSVANLPIALNDSVDADDGAVDGTRIGGRAASTFQVTLTFDAMALGGLPTHVGIVATNRTSGPAVDVTVEAFGPAGVSLGTVVAPALGASNSTADDRFLGWISPEGIGSIRLITSSAGASLRWDHLQYGRPLPTVSLDPRPAALALLIGVLLGARLTASAAARRAAPSRAPGSAAP